MTQSEQDELLADYLPCAEIVRISHPPLLVPACRDPQDQPFMQLAVAGQAQALVSGDQDLLAIAVEFERATGCPMWSLEAFLSNALFAIRK